MRFEIARRLFLILLSVALATAPAMGSARAVAMDITASAATATDMPMSGMPMSGMPMSGKCNGCAGNEKGMAATCAVHCGSTIALLPVLIGPDRVAIETLGPLVAPAATGHVFPPDPYPPRPSILN